MPRFQLLWQLTQRNLFFALLIVAVPLKAEPLEYSVVYRGVFSMGQDMPIADLRLETREIDRSRRFCEISLDASSIAYPVVESLYPLRYRFRTWTTARPADVVGFETYERTRKLRHRLYLRSSAESGFSRYDLAQGAGLREVDQLSAGEIPVAAELGDLLLDRLGLLQHIRDKTLREGAEYRLPVTNGRNRLTYRVRVEAAQSLMLQGVKIAAWKVRFDGEEIDANGVARPAHRPLYVWFNRAPGHVPLRVDSRHAIGLFRVQLSDPVALPQLADATVTQSSTNLR